jgi:hypothetical protein
MPPTFGFPLRKERTVGLVLLLILLALVVGGIGLLVKGFLWLLVIAGALILVGAVLGVRGRSQA